MKKTGIFLITLLVCAFLISLSFAQETPAPEGLQGGVERIVEIGEGVTDEGGNIQVEYLKQEWKNILANSSIGRFMDKTQQSLQPINPVFKVMTGLEFSWSFLFILNLALWFCLVIYSYRLLEFVALVSRALKLLIAVAFVVLISVSGITRSLSNFILETLNKLPNTLMQLVSFVILLVILIFLSIYSTFLRDIAIKMKEKKQLKKASETAKEAKAEAETAKQEQDNFYKDVAGFGS